MSSTSSQELAASASASKELECGQSRSAKSIPIVAESSLGAGQASPAIKMSAISEPTGSEQAELPLMLSAVASPAKTSALQAARQALRDRVAAYGRKSSDWLASYDRSTSSWRTSQTSLLDPKNDQAAGLAEFWETWPRSGWMSNGIAYRLPDLVPTSLATECGSSPRLPRPVAVDGKGAGRLRWERIHGGGMNLRDWFVWKFNMAYPPARLVEYLMGFPAGWICSVRSATPSSRKSRKSSDAQS
jgi:hypothetical protein